MFDVKGIAQCYDHEFMTASLIIYGNKFM